MEDNNTPEAPTPCTAGCGFYGNKIYNNMCSKCFKEQDEQRNKNAQVESTTTSDDMTTLIVDKKVATKVKEEEEEAEKVSNIIIIQPQPQAPEEEKEAIKPIQKNKGRCFSCRIKIPLAKQLTNKCRCEYVFCDTHRYPDKHECKFDHAKNDKDILLKNNPKLHDKPRGGNSFNRLDSI